MAVATPEARRAYLHDLVPGAVIRVGGDSLHARPYGLEITRRGLERDGRIGLTGRLLAQDGTTKRQKPTMRFAAVDPSRAVLLRKAAPPEFTVKIATLMRVWQDADSNSCTSLTTRWGVVNDQTGEPLPGGGTGPATADGHVMAGDWDGKPTPWLAKEPGDLNPEEERLRRDPIKQCTDRVRQERGILRVGENLTYDLSVWPHTSAQELRATGDGTVAWRDTYVCKRCHQKLKWLGRTPWTAALDGDEECHGEVWTP